MSPRRHPKSPRNSCGVAAVELGLLITPLLVMMLGATEFGRAIYTYNNLDKAVRDAARHLSQHGPGDTGIQAQARCMAVYVSGCSGSLIAPELTEGNVILRDALSAPGTHAAQATGSGVVNLVSVTIVGYRFRSAVAFDVIPATIDFNNISVTMRAQL